MDRNKLKLAVLMIVIFLPITLATYMFMVYEGQGIGATTNNGSLIRPVLDVAEFGLRDAQGNAVFEAFDEMVADVDPEDYEPRPWTLVFLGTASCDTDCRDRLYYLRQVHRRLGAEAPRIQRLYGIVGDGRVQLNESTREYLDSEQPRMIIAGAQRHALLETLKRSHEAGRDPVDEHYIYVVDPVGNVMLYFTPANGPEDILEDVETLLERSSLG